MNRDSASNPNLHEPRRAGLTLLEVILALAILAAALATLGELMGIGTRSAAEARDLTMAQLLCESKMSELTARVIPLESMQRARFEYNTDWLYSVTVQSTEEEHLFAVRVVVEQNVDPRKRPVSFALDRWVIDPDLELQEEQTTEGEAVETGGGATNASQGDQNG